jgi:hypothetical protein
VQGVCPGLARRRRSRSPRNDLALMVYPGLKHLILTIQRRRAQAPHWIEAHPAGFRVEMRDRIRAVGYVLVSLSMTRGTYKRIRLRTMLSFFGLTNPVERKSMTSELITHSWLENISPGEYDAHLACETLHHDFTFPLCVIQRMTSAEPASSFEVLPVFVQSVHKLLFILPLSLR